MKKLIAFLLIVFVLVACMPQKTEEPVQEPLPTVQAGSSIQSAVNNAAAGDTIIVGSGSYNERVKVAKAGIRLECEPANTCQVKGFDMWGTNGALVNFKIYNATLVGIDVHGSGNLIQGNDISQIIFNGDDSDCMRGWGSGHTFRANFCHDIYISGAPHLDGFQSWADASRGGEIRDSLFEDNVFILTTSLADDITAGFQLEGNEKNLVIRNNVVKALAGIRAYKGNGSAAPSNITVTNNTFIVGLQYSTSSGAIAGTFAGTSGIVWKNNIAIDLPTRPLDLSGGVTDYNLYYNSNGKTPSNGSRGAHDLFQVNPLLDASYHPASNSPACTGGENGTYIGAFPCGVQPVTLTSAPPTITRTATITALPATRTPTRTMTSTATITPSRTPTRVSSQTPTGSATASQTITPIIPSRTATNTPVPPTNTLIPSVTSTRTPTQTLDSSITATFTPIPPTVTPTPEPPPPPVKSCDWNKNGRISWLEALLCRWFGPR